MEGSNLSQAGSQASALLPTGEGSNLYQAGRCSLSSWGRKLFISGRHSPSLRGSEQLISGRQALSFPLGNEAVYLRQAGRQVVTSQADALLPLGEGSSSAASYTGSQAGTHLPPGEGSNLSQAGRQASQASQAAGRPVSSPSPEEGDITVASSASQAGAHPPAWENSSQAGQSGRQGTSSGRQLPRHSARQRALQASQGNSTASQADSVDTEEGILTPNPPVGFPKGLPEKTPTLSGSLTYPANV